MAIMNEARHALASQLEAYYQSCGWRVRRADDGTLEADGPGGVTWYGAAIVAEDVHGTDALDAWLVELANRRMLGGGELCPLDLLPDPEAEAGLREALERTKLNHRPHVSVYELSAAA